MKISMVKAIHRKPESVGPLDYSVTRLSCVRARCVALGLALLCAVFAPAIIARASCSGIHVEILGIRNNAGTVACALFESAEGFPTEFLKKADNISIIKIHDKQARCDFLNVPTGTYALAVIHDENMDGSLATNWLGVPSEGYGFSENAKTFLSAPAFNEASFIYTGEKLNMSIPLNY